MRSTVCTLRVYSTATGTGGGALPSLSGDPRRRRHCPLPPILSYPILPLLPPRHYNIIYHLQRSSPLTPSARPRREERYILAVTPSRPSPPHSRPHKSTPPPPLKQQQQQKEREKKQQQQPPQPQPQPQPQTCRKCPGPTRPPSGPSPGTAGAPTAASSIRSGPRSASAPCSAWSARGCTGELELVGWLPGCGCCGCCGRCGRCGCCG